MIFRLARRTAQMDRPVAPVKLPCGWLGALLATPANIARVLLVVGVVEDRGSVCASEMYDDPRILGWGGAFALRAAGTGQVQISLFRAMQCFISSELLVRARCTHLWLE